MSPRAGWTLKADYHHFRTQTDISGSDADTITALDGTLGGAGTVKPMDQDMGAEIDLTVVHKYDANTKIVAGYSHYMTTYTYAEIQGGGGANNNDDSDWSYIQIHTKF